SHFYERWIWRESIRQKPVQRSDILERLEPLADDLMAEKGFYLEDKCNKLGIQIIQPPTYV
ncbi:hypothetical protein HPB47_023200, partial [Ixodes persulcatus]